MSDPVETDEAISAELLQWADSIDAEGDDLRPLLRRAAEALADRHSQIKSAVNGAAKLADEITRLRARVERLRAALKPFANRADRYDPHEDNDDQEPDWSTAAPDIRIGDLRCARAAYGGDSAPETKKAPPSRS